MLDRILSMIEGLSLGGAFLSAFGMAAIVLLIVVEIVLRSLFDTSTLVASEYGGYLLVAVVCFGFAYTMREGAFIRISFVRHVLPAPLQRMLDSVAGVAGAVITGYALKYSAVMVWETYDLEITADTIAETPLWVPQLTIPLGLFMLLLQIVAFTMRRVRDDQ